jgi:hypothetical protein
MPAPRAALPIAMGFGIVYLAALITLPSPPSATAPPVTVAAWFQSHSDAVRIWVWLMTVAGSLFAVLVGLLRSALPAPHRDVFLVGGIAFTSQTATALWLWAGMALHPDLLQPATARALLDVADYYGPILTAATTVMLLPIALVALGHSRRLPRWVGWVSLLAFAEQAIETVTVFGRGGFIAPNGAMNNLLGAGLVGLALLAFTVAACRAPRMSEARAG